MGTRSVVAKRAPNYLRPNTKHNTMIPTKFDYHKASSLEEAIQLLSQNGDDAKLLAGGHSLIPAMKLRLNQTGALIDISKLEDLRYIRQDGEELLIGANATHDDIAHSELLQSRMPMLPETAEWIGDMQVRNKGTLGGSLAHADPAADWPAAMLAGDARIVMQGPNGRREVSAEDFFLGFYMTALGEDEILTEVRIPLPPENTGMSYQKFMQPASRFAIVGCAATVTSQGGKCERVRVAFAGVADAAFRDEAIEAALNGQPLTAETIEAAAQKAAGDAMIMEDHFASEEYRRHLAKVYAKRALMAAAAM